MIIDNMKRKFYHFHTGRHDKQNKSIKIIKNMYLTTKDVCNFIEERLYLKERDSLGKMIFMWTDCDGNDIITNRELINSIKKGRLVIEHDTIYDTDIFVTIDKILDDEKALLKEF